MEAHTLNPTAPKRYQLKKETAQAVRHGHPWIYRDKISTAATVFRSGQMLQLVGADNEILGYGVYEDSGLVAIRVLKQGSTPADRVWLTQKLEKAIARRQNVCKYTDAFRLLHGENDGIPGVVLDVYGRTAVLQTYAPSIDALGRYLGSLACTRLRLKNLLWKFPVKRKDPKSDRVLRGKAPLEVVVREGELQFTIPVVEGQKSGAFLDLRGLRKWVTGQKFTGKRVLNLFAYTGTLGLAAESAGAREIWNVDISKGALEVASRNVLQNSKHRFISADIFEWLPKLDPKEKFDLIIVDPPMMAAKMDQVENALRAYRRLYRESLKHLAPHGTLVACCCTSRISRRKFEQVVQQSLGERLKKVKSLAPEDDHPVGFPEGDYLKILVYR